MKLLLLLLAIGLNRTYSPDSTKVAYTLDNDLYVEEVASGRQTRLTFDGSDVIMNGYASWVYYEEILGRGSRYKAFWWSPDSQRIGFYRFDDSEVPMFPIYSPFGQDGVLRRTHYPKAGETNPEVRIGIVTVADGKTVWADFDEKEDQYFGIPFWGKDSREFFIAREPRIQNRFDLYSVSVEDGSKKLIYHEEYKTWVEWIEQVIFTDKGLYMARNFETGWQQIYFLSYDGKTFRRLTDGQNWDIMLLKVDEKKGDIWFTAKRDSRIHPALYRLDKRGRITALTDPAFYLSGVRLSKDGKTFTASQSTAAVPTQQIKGRTDRFQVEVTEDFAARFDLDTLPSPQLVQIQNDGFELYGLISYPKGFDPSRRYPVLMQLYGGPGTPYVRDYWQSRDASDRWCFDNGIIYIVVDPRSSGENGRAGMDEAFRQMTVTELGDYIAWAKYLQGLPYVQGDRIGVEGFSFGGTTTAMLVLRALGYSGTVSSSGPDNPLALKESIWRAASERLGIKEGSFKGLGLEAAAELGDPMQVAAAAYVAALPKRVRVTLAGGTQMMAVAAILRDMGVERDLLVATTKYVHKDPSSCFESYAKQIGTRWYAAPLDFSHSRFTGLADYEKGFIKEGVGAGGAVWYAEQLGVPVERVQRRTEALYEKMRSGS